MPKKPKKEERKRSKSNPNPPRYSHAALKKTLFGYRRYDFVP